VYHCVSLYHPNLYGKFVFDSTISHIGFLLLSLAINTEQSIDSFLFYLIQYTITNLNIFLIILAVTYITSGPAQYKTGKREDIRYISELKGLFFSNPLLSLSLCISLFSMAGIPPLIGFFSKQFVLYSAIQNGYYFISIIAIIVSVISASYYLKIIKILHTDPSSNNKAQQAPQMYLGPSVGKNSCCVKAMVITNKCKATVDQASINSSCISINNKNKQMIILGLEPSNSTLTNTHSFLISSLT
jgi:NADH-ubiquinone oxidoreductase chain 2